MSPSEQERLYLLLEEMGEVQHEVLKILRHGYASHHPKRPASNNRDMLTREIGDLLSAIDLMLLKCDLDEKLVEKARKSKTKRRDRWMRHQ